MALDRFRCLLVAQHGPDVKQSVAELPVEALPAGDVLVQVAYSSLNYKDAMAARGDRGIVKRFPHVPGIDAAGTVVASNSPLVQLGDEVIVTGHDLGQGHWGAWSELIRVPADWVVALPEGLGMREAMVLGTAGFTAVQCVLGLRQNGVLPEPGEIVVTGATGGVGTWVVNLLVKLGYTVVAVTGKAEQHASLLDRGVSRVCAREDLLDSSARPLLSARWSGGVDTVGGKLLTSLLRQTRYGGCVAACGLVAGAELEMTLYPFLLRGITLCGVASADCPPQRRREIWSLLAGDWMSDLPCDLVTEVELPQIMTQVTRMLAGEIAGRVLVNTQ